MRRLKTLFNAKKANRKYKDLLFKYVFKDKKSLLLLYNVLNDSEYTDENELEITTIENAIYMTYKNDVSFLLSNTLVIYEHQSSFNPNMPVRGLIYYADRYEAFIRRNHLNIYGSKQVNLPTPQYIIFYNGAEEKPDCMKLKLSDAFTEQKEEPSLEVVATMLNINYGHNMELLNKCKPLMEYAQFVEQVRIFHRKFRNLEKAIKHAIDYCIAHNIMADVLRENRGGVEKMLLTEFDMKEYVRAEKRESVEEGREEGEERLATLIKCLITDGRIAEIEHVVEDVTYRKKVYDEYKMNK